MRSKPAVSYRKYAELIQKEKYLEVINEFATKLIQAESIDEILWAVTSEAISKLNWYDCVIYLYDEKKKVLVQRSAFGPKNPKDLQILNPISIKPGQGIVGTVFTTGIGEIVNDTSRDKRYIADDDFRFSEITIPIIHQDKILGVIDSEHPKKNFFTEQDYKLLTTVSAMVSTKLAQAKSAEQVKKYQINLEKLVHRKTRQLEESNRDLRSKNKEKEVLFREVHHRVKNNMQIIISLLNIQANLTENEHERIVFDESKNRIRSMALIHERLYLEKDISNISLPEYTKELTQELSSSYSGKNQVEVILQQDALQINIDHAIPVGLILNELVTNSLKHAFIESGGNITIETHVDEKNILHLRFHDTGPGFEYEHHQGKSFGLELIEILVAQLNGTLTYNNDKGSEYLMHFPL